MFHPLGPAQIAHVDQAVDSILDLDKRTKVGKVSDPALHRHTHGILIVQSVPRIGRELPHAQRDSALSRIHVENHALDLIAYIHQLGRMLHALGPGHFADVNQAFDALFEFYECAVVGDADYAPGYMSAHWIAVFRIEPGIGGQLLESERHPLLIFIVFQHLDLDLIADIHQIARMRQASPRHVGNVQQTVQASEIHESSVLREVFHHPGQYRAFFQMFQSLAAFLGLLAF